MSAVLRLAGVAGLVLVGLLGDDRRGRRRTRCLDRRRQRPLIAPEVARQHLLHDGRRDRATVLAGVLDDARHGDLGCLDRREGDEPGVVLRLAYPTHAVAAFTKLDRLRRPGLAGDGDAGDARLLAGARVGLDDVAHAGPHLLERARLQVHGAEYFRLHVFA